MFSKYTPYSTSPPPVFSTLNVLGGIVPPGTKLGNSIVLSSSSYFNSNNAVLILTLVSLVLPIILVKK